MIFFNFSFSDAWADRLNVIPNNTEAVALGAITVRSNSFFLIEVRTLGRERASEIFHLSCARY